MGSIASVWPTVLRRVGTSVVVVSRFACFDFATRSVLPTEAVTRVVPRTRPGRVHARGLGRVDSANMRNAEKTHDVHEAVTRDVDAMRAKRGRRAKSNKHFHFVFWSFLFSGNERRDVTSKLLPLLTTQFETHGTRRLPERNGIDAVFPRKGETPVRGV